MVQRRKFEDSYAVGVPWDNESYEAMRDNFVTFAVEWNRMRTSCSPGMLIRGMRKAMGISQQTLAETLGIEQGVLSKYESDKTVVPVGLIDHVVFILMQSIEQLRR